MAAGVPRLDLSLLPTHTSGADPDILLTRSSSPDDQPSSPSLPHLNLEEVIATREGGARRHSISEESPTGNSPVKEPLAPLSARMARLEQVAAVVPKSPRLPNSPKSFLFSPRLSSHAREKFPQLSGLFEAKEPNFMLIGEELLSDPKNPELFEACHALYHYCPEKIGDLFSYLFYGMEGISFIYDYLNKYPKERNALIEKIVSQATPDRGMTSALDLLTKIEVQEKQLGCLQEGISFSFATKYAESFFPPAWLALTDNLSAYSAMLKKTKSPPSLAYLLDLILSMQLPSEIKEILGMRRVYFEHLLTHSADGCHWEKMISVILCKYLLVPRLTRFETKELKHSLLRDGALVLQSLANQTPPDKPQLKEAYDSHTEAYAEFIRVNSDVPVVVSEELKLTQLPPSSLTCSSSSSSESPKRHKKRIFKTFRKRKSVPDGASSSSSGVVSNPLLQQVKTEALWTILNDEIQFDLGAVGTELMANFKMGKVAKRVLSPILTQIGKQNIENPELEMRLETLLGFFHFDVKNYQFIQKCVLYTPHKDYASLEHHVKGMREALKLQEIPFGVVRKRYAQITQECLVDYRDPRGLLREANLSSYLYRELMLHYAPKVFESYVDRICAIFRPYWNSIEMTKKEAYRAFISHSIEELLKLNVPLDAQSLLITQAACARTHIASLPLKMTQEELEGHVVVNRGGELALRVINPLLVDLIKGNTPEEGARWFIDLTMILQKVMNQCPFNGNISQMAFPDLAVELYTKYVPQARPFLQGLAVAPVQVGSSTDG